MNQIRMEGTQNLHMHNRIAYMYVPLDNQDLPVVPAFVDTGAE